MDIKYITPVEVAKIHDVLIQYSGGLPGDGGSKCIDSVCHSAETYHSDQTLEGISSYYLSRIAKDHCFNDGNKRTAYLSSRYFLMLNGADFNGSDYDIAADEIEAIAASKTMQEAYETAMGFTSKYIVTDQLTIPDFHTFDRLVLKSLAVTSLLSDR